MNRGKFEDAGHARNPFPLTSILSLRERRNHSAPWAQKMGVGGSLVPMHARSGRRLSMNLKTVCLIFKDFEVHGR